MTNQSPAVASLDRAIDAHRESLNMASESVALADPGSADETHGRLIVRTRDAALTALINARRDVVAAERFAARSW